MPDSIAAQLEARLSAKVDSLKSEAVEQVGQPMRDLDGALQARLNHIESWTGPAVL